MRADCGHSAWTTTATARPALETTNAGTGVPRALTPPNARGMKPARASENAVRTMM